jgi:Holliday junction resolvasome RuvABC endonuclease subunit
VIVVGIDPARVTGWAVFEDGQRVASGAWDLDHDIEQKTLKTEPEDHRHGRRFAALHSMLVDLCAGFEVDRIAYERVWAHRGARDAHHYGGLRGVVCRFAFARGIACEGIAFTTVKKAATGNGRADKEQMLAAAQERWPLVETHDEADACWIAVCGGGG